MKRLLIIFMAVMLLTGCGISGGITKSVTETEAEEFLTETTESAEGQNEAEAEAEGINRVTNLDLDAFIKSYNGLSGDAGKEMFVRNGNESIVADGLLISMNEDGSVWGIVQPVQPTALSVVSTLSAIKSQSNDEDAEKIDTLLEEFAKAMDESEEHFIETINIESMEISISTINGEVFMFNVLGDEQP